MSAHDHTHDHDDDEHLHGEDEDFREPTPEETFGEPVPAALVPLRAGPVSLWFDREWGFLRRFLVNGREALRAIYPAVRAADWQTVPPKFEDVQIDAKADSFRITFEAVHVHEASGLDFRWKGTLTGESDGSVTYDFAGTARTAFRTNRTGLCVLHPGPDCAGRALTVEHVDGRLTKGHFPELISPHQPFFDIRAVTHQVTDGLLAKVTCEGDTFEMEDQRNWTDASFKTYGGPLSRPIPLSFPENHAVHQTVRFELIGQPAPETHGPDVVTLTLPDHGTVPVPSIGTRWAPDADPLDDETLAALKDMGLGHFLIDVDLTSDTWRGDLARGLLDAQAVGVKVLLRVILTPNHQPSLHELAGDLASSFDSVLGLTVSSRTEACPGAVTLGLVRSVFGVVAPELPIAAAPVDNFADMNRHRPPDDFWCAPPMCPQVHNFDNTSLLENLQGQLPLLKTVRSFNPHPMFVGPVALLRRRKADRRQNTLFAGAWTAGSLATVLPTGFAAAVTYHEHGGGMGFPGTPAEDVIAGLAGLAHVAPVGSSAPDRVAAVAGFAADGERRVLIANLTGHTVTISVPETEDEVEFGPHATAWLSF